MPPVVLFVLPLVLLAAHGAADAPADTPSEEASIAPESPQTDAPNGQRGEEPIDKSPTPLDDDAKSVFLGSPEDPPAKKLLGVNSAFAGRHYLSGDEYRLDCFGQSISDLGGGYVGVGTDQAYLLIGWAKPELAWLIDYDALVPHVHQIYRAFFLEAEDADAFLSLWQRDSVEAAQAALRRHAPDADLAMKVLAKARAGASQRLTRLRRDHQARGVDSYLTDPAQYRYVRAMMREGRVRPMLANLLTSGGLAGVGQAARELGVTIRTIYLSNAEEYWRYGATFRENIKSLPFDERSMVLRTRSTFSRNRDYQYNVQPALEYVTWLSLPNTTRVNDIAPKRPARANEYPVIPAKEPPRTSEE